MFIPIIWEDEPIFEHIFQQGLKLNHLSLGSGAVSPASGLVTGELGGDVGLLGLLIDWLGWRVCMFVGR